MAHEETKLKLPALVYGPVDVGRLIRELSSLNDNLLQMKLRKTGTKVNLAKPSPLLDQLATINKLNLIHDEDRQVLEDFLAKVKASAPVVHMSFSADPSPLFLDKLITWLRREIDPLILLNIGLQPNIGAGCILRTNNQVFDLSLKQDFIRKRELLVSKLVPASLSQEPKEAPAESLA